MDLDFLNRIEEAALNAWPSPRQILYDGWLMRFTGGSSKRVNSVNIRYPSTLSIPEKISYCENLYALQGLPTLFRTPDPFTSPDVLRVLAEAGYSAFDPTFVMGRPILRSTLLPAGVEIRQMNQDDWFALRSELTGHPAEYWDNNRRILDAIADENLLLGLFVDDIPAVSGMGVLERQFLGYFSIYTSDAYRRCGYAQTMMGALGNWGVSRGAVYGYLQVEGHNQPALALYEKLGFEHCYRYVYFGQGIITD